MAKPTARALLVGCAVALVALAAATGCSKGGSTDPSTRSPNDKTNPGPPPGKAFLQKGQLPPGAQPAKAPTDAPPGKTGDAPSTPK
jgi:hypothetical protein